MSTESITEILRAFLAKEGVVLCRPLAHESNLVPLDGVKELTILREVAILVEDAKSIGGVEEWDDVPTKEIPQATLRMLRHQAVQMCGSVR